MRYVVGRLLLGEGTQHALGRQTLFELGHSLQDGQQGRLAGQNQRELRLAARFEVGQQPQRLERMNVFKQMGLIDHDHGMAARPAVFLKELLDPLHALRDGRAVDGPVGVVQLIGQVGQQLGRGHLGKHQMHERRELLAEHLAERTGDQRLARAGRAGEQGASLSVLDGVTQLQQGRLMRLAREVVSLIGEIFERFGVELPVGLVHGDLRMT